MIVQATSAATPPTRPGGALRAPADWPSRFLLVLLALTVSGLGAAVAGRLAWPSTPVTSEAQAVAAAQTALPVEVVRVVERSAESFTWDPPLIAGLQKSLVPVLGGEGYRYGTVRLTAETTGEPAAVLDGARAALTDAGWTVDRLTEDPYNRQFAAHTATTMITLRIATKVGEAGLIEGRYEPAVEIEVGPRPPSGSGPPMLAGLLLGGLAGWLLGLPLVRRIATASTRRPALLSFAQIGLLLAAPLALVEWFVAFRYVRGLEPAAFGWEILAPWHPYTSIFLRGPALLGAAIVLSVTVIAVVTRRDHSPE